MDDYIDQEGYISIWRLMSPSSASRAARRLPRELCDRIAQHRLAQMAEEAAQNLIALNEARTRKSE